MRRPTELETPARLLGLEHEARAHHHLQDHALGRERVLGDPICKGEVDRGKRRHVELCADRLEPFRVQRLPALWQVTPDDPDPLHRSERDDDKIAGAEGFLLSVEYVYASSSASGRRTGAVGGATRARKPLSGAFASRRGSSDGGMAGKLADGSHKCNSFRSVDIFHRGYAAAGCITVKNAIKG